MGNLMTFGNPSPTRAPPGPGHPHSDPSQQGRLLWLIWAALLQGPLMMAGVVSFAFTTPDADAQLDMAAMIVGVAAILAVGSSFVLPSVLPGSRIQPALRASLIESDRGEQRDALMPQLEAALLMGYRSRCLLTWGLAEVGGMAAASTQVLMRGHVLGLSALALYVLAMLLCAPTGARLRSYLEDRTGDLGVSLHEVHRQL